MTGKEKIEAAFSEEGTAEIPAVICYERIFFRDHWDQLRDGPWWHYESPVLEQQLQWHRKVAQQIGQDWIRLYAHYLEICECLLMAESRHSLAYCRSQTVGPA